MTGAAAQGSDAVAGDERIVVGEIVGPFGHRGEVKVYPHTDFPARIVALAIATIRRPEGTEADYRVIRARLHKAIVVMTLEGVSTMNDAEALRGSRIVVAPSDRATLPLDTFYIDDLVGLQVKTDDGRPLGPILKVLKGPANDVYDLGHLLIPAIRDVVTEIDVRNGLMTIHAIPGLLDHQEIA